MQRRDFMTRLAAGTFLASLSGKWAHASRPQGLADLDAMATAQIIGRGEVSPREVISAAMARIDALNPELNAVVTKSYDYAERQLQQGLSGPLRGVPYLFKDLSPVKDIRLTYGSRAFANYIADAQHAYTDKTLETGLVVLGKTNTPEFGLMASTESHLLGAAHNPWNVAHSTAGSSGGAAAAVAAGMVPIAQASDGGGSIRLPSSACGVFGLKPTRGRFPKQGTNRLPINLSIKHVCSRTVRDSAFMVALTENNSHARDIRKQIGFIEGASNKKRHFALSLESQGYKADRDTENAVREVGRVLQDLGHSVEEVRETPLTTHPDSVENFLTLWAFGAYQTVRQVERLTAMPAAKSKLVEPWTLGLAQLYETKPAGIMENVLQGLEKVSADIYKFFTKYDGWIKPVSAFVTPKIGYFDPAVEFNELLERTSHYAAFTPLHNAAGTPSMSVPGYWSADNVPVGVQIAAGLGREDMLLEIAYELEAARPWAHKRPEVYAGV